MDFTGYDAVTAVAGYRADPVGWTVKDPLVTVPAAYSVNIGTIKD